MTDLGAVEISWRLISIKKAAVSIPYRCCCFPPEGIRYGVLSYFQRPAFFSSEFSVLPRLFFANLRADSLSDANLRKMRALCKALDIKCLYIREIFGRAISTVLAHDTARFRASNAP